MILVNVAAALLELGKQVVLVDVPGQKKGRGGRGAASSKKSERVVLETDAANGTSTEPGYEVLPSGIRVLHIDMVSAGEDEAATSSLSLIEKVCKNNDYVLIDLPLTPSPFTTAILKNSGLTIIMGDYRLSSIPDIQNVVKLFRFLGMKAEGIAAVLVDPEGEAPGLSLGNIKPYIEANLGITLAEVISFDAKMCQFFYLDSQPVVQSNPDQPFAQNIKQIARFIMACDYTGLETPPSRRVISSLEKSH
jgi:MinD-like ATPase involved in chromosome partitioning or flagellar assembly